jgi:hypothetical protein
MFLLFYIIQSEIGRLFVTKSLFLQKSRFTVKWSIQAVVRANNAITANSKNNYGKGSSIHLGIFDEAPLR